MTPIISAGALLLPDAGPDAPAVELTGRVALLGTKDQWSGSFALDALGEDVDPQPLYGRLTQAGVQLRLDDVDYDGLLEVAAATPQRGSVTLAGTTPLPDALVNGDA